MRILQQFKGRLTPAQAAYGINAAVANAKRLAEDAKLLLEAKRYPSASSLAILSLEELGKRAILRELLTAPSDVEVQDCWRRYRRHTQKNYLALLPDRLRGGAKHLHEFRDLFLECGEAQRTTVDAIKQLGFYTDCCGSVHWATPPEVVNEKVASELVSLVWALSESKESLPRKLDPQKAKSANVQKLELDEKKFRYLVNDNAMATEKTAEGIRKFAADIVKLEKFIAGKL